MDNLFENVESNLPLEVKEKVDRAYMLADIIVEPVKKRVELGMSQRDLAKKTGIKQPMIARIETLKTIPRIDTLISIVTALNLDLKLIEK